jgi:two-component system response regulator HydG
VRFTVRGVLEDAGYRVYDAPDGATALQLALGPAAPAVVITDLRMPGMDGLALLAELNRRPDPPRVILLTAHGDERVAVSAMKAGAWDYFRKPFEIDELVSVVDRAAQSFQLRAENERLQGELALAGSLVFRSEPMRRLATLVQRVGPRDVTVLITGESGTGKERVAESIVRASSRAERPFLRFNCAALSPELVEAELFGHLKGSFTGASRDRPGLFREAHTGTLLLDEIGELAPSVQARLLRTLQSGEVRPVGSDRVEQVDVRILAATHRDLARMVEEGSFRSDLYFRLRVVQLHVPSLRERPDDIPVLARHFIQRFSERFGTGAVRPPAGWLEALAARPWPGNVRELENTIEMLVALSVDGELDPSLIGGDAPLERAGLTLPERIDAYERGLLVEALRSARGNKSEAARVLGVSRVTLYEKLRRHRIQEDRDGS